MNRIAWIVVSVAVVFSGCSKSQPELSDEQVKAAKFLQEQFDPRLYVINERFGKVSFSDIESQSKWVATLMKLNEQFNCRKVESGHEAAITWYDAESKRPAAELIATWGPKGE